MGKYVTPPGILREFKRIFIVNQHLPPFSVEKEWVLSTVWGVKEPDPWIIKLPQSAIEGPEPNSIDADDQRI